MDKRCFMVFLGGGAIAAVAGCSSTPDLDLPEPDQINKAPWQVAAGMVGLAHFSARVLVLSRKDYSEDPADSLSAVSPIDLAVSWGIAAKRDVRRAMQISQASRRMLWKARTSDMTMPGVAAFTRYSGNWHMIPADDAVAETLKRVAVGDVVRIEGDLVQVTFTNGIFYRSSMTRDDVGDGACEIIRATSVVVERSGA